jgi:hypothetical protein
MNSLAREPPVARAAGFGSDDERAFPLDHDRRYSLCFGRILPQPIEQHLAKDFRCVNLRRIPKFGKLDEARVRDAGRRLLAELGLIAQAATPVHPGLTGTAEAE